MVLILFCGIAGGLLSATIAQRWPPPLFGFEGAILLGIAGGLLFGVARDIFSGVGGSIQEAEVDSEPKPLLHNKQ
jgi:hypothetical protein